MVLNAGSLDRRVQVRRDLNAGNHSAHQLSGGDPDWQDHGDPINAKRRDVSDAERFSAGIYHNKLVTRFTVRSTPFTRGIRRTDRLVHDGVTFSIDGIKELPDTRAFLEITAVTAGAS